MSEQSLYMMALDTTKRITDSCETKEECSQMLEILGKLVNLRFLLTRSLSS